MTGPGDQKDPDGDRQNPDKVARIHVLPKQEPAE